MKGSWRTSVAGLVVALGLLMPQYEAYADGDPLTKVDWKVVVTAFGALGFGVAARDNKVSSASLKLPEKKGSSQ